MIHLALSILASTAVLIIFKWMQTNGANTRHSITLSYLASAVTGIVIFSPGVEFLKTSWFWAAAIEGGAFYLVFRLMAKTTQVNGIAIASIATKMGVVIPISIGIFLLDESVNAFKLAGILLGITAVLLSTGNGFKQGEWRWPLLVFLGTGCIDASFKLFQIWGVTESQFPGLVTTIFSFAFAVGLIHHFFSADRKIARTSIISAICLGLANFGTVYFLLKALALTGWESSVVYPFNNFGIITLSTLSAMIIYKENLSRKGWSGLSLAIAAIGLLYLGSTR